MEVRYNYNGIRIADLKSRHDARRPFLFGLRDVDPRYSCILGSVVFGDEYLQEVDILEFNKFELDGVTRGQLSLGELKLLCAGLSLRIADAEMALRFIGWTKENFAKSSWSSSEEQ
ncbi:hypothetical protein HWI79_2969 [Cryptosporidium felis]|nr:hypothetical protein HWI79_2969 [Cryptosporidium felis]